MIALTGGAGFIGANFLEHLNHQGISDILLVDTFSGCTSEPGSLKWKNLIGKQFLDFITPEEFLEATLRDKFPDIKAIVHLGACSSTTETNAEYLLANNYQYTKALASWALAKNIRFIYASSAATYGDGTNALSSGSFSDDPALVPQLKPLNLYAFSKQLFDLWALRSGALNKIVGLKFFNVYGPYEAHKGEMASVIFKAYGQIKATGKVKLFKSYRPDYADGEQKRDFVYVKDCSQVLETLLHRKDLNGLFNLGSGIARSWNDLAKAVFQAMSKPVNIEYIEMPDAIRDKYQYLTQAEMRRLRAILPEFQPYSLEEGALDYCIWLTGQDVTP